MTNGRAKTTGERLVMIETKMDVIQQDVSEIKQSIKQHMEWEEKKYNDLKDVYAGKWTEKVTYGLISAIIAIALTIIFGV
jgi:hypothetical protein